MSTFNEELLRLAVKHEKSVSFTYAKGKQGKNLEERALLPSEVAATKTGAMFAVGLDLDRNEVRAYRLDRIMGTVGIG